MRPKGFAHSEETKKKMSESQLGRKFSPEHLANLRAAHRRRSERGGYKGSNNGNWDPDRDAVNRRKKMSKIVYGLVGRALAHLGKKKIGHGLELLGYTPDELRSNIEKSFKPGMTWENHGAGSNRWHIDHIIPVSDFGPEATVAEINALSNLRPLWERENLSLGGVQGCKMRYRRRKT